MEEIKQLLEEIGQKVEMLWQARLRIDMPLVERNVIAGISEQAALQPIYSATTSGATPSGFVKTTIGNRTRYTHNLGNDRYAVVASMNTTGFVQAYVQVENKTSTQFEVVRYNTSGTEIAGDNAWILFQNNNL